MLGKSHSQFLTSRGLVRMGKSTTMTYQQAHMELVQGDLEKVCVLVWPPQDDHTISAD
jgi:hypothetical protein